MVVVVVRMRVGWLWDAFWLKETTWLGRLARSVGGLRARGAMEFVKWGVDSVGFWSFDKQACIYERWVRAWTVHGDRLWQAIDVLEDEGSSHRDDEQQRAVLVAKTDFS